MKTYETFMDEMILYILRALVARIQKEHRGSNKTLKKTNLMIERCLQLINQVTRMPEVMRFQYRNVESEVYPIIQMVVDP
jgi:hypothetical protein